MQWRCSSHALNLPYGVDLLPPVLVNGILLLPSATALSPLLMHWRYSSLALNYPYSVGLPPQYLWMASFPSAPIQALDHQCKSHGRESPTSEIWRFFTPALHWNGNITIFTSVSAGSCKHQNCQCSQCWNYLSKMLTYPSYHVIFRRSLYL